MSINNIIVNKLDDAKNTDVGLKTVLNCIKLIEGDGYCPKSNG